MYLLFWIHMCTLRYYRGWGVTSFRRRPDVLDRYMCFQTIISITTYDICFSYFFVCLTHTFSLSIFSFFQVWNCSRLFCHTKGIFSGPWIVFPLGYLFGPRRALCDIFIFFIHTAQSQRRLCFDVARYPPRLLYRSYGFPFHFQLLPRAL